jgi:DNA-binding LytR/AlgR family response regulator
MNFINVAPDHLFLREGTTYIKIPLTEIEYIQADGNYAYLQTNNKRFAVKRSLATIEEDLSAPAFVRISRGIMVNFDRVKKVSFANGIIEVGTHELKMGKAYHTEVKNRMPRL